MVIRCIKLGLFVAVLCLGLITCINPIYPHEQFLQHMGTLLILMIPIADLRSIQLSLSAYAYVSDFVIK